MPLSKDDVKRLGELARLELSEGEVGKAQDELERILGYVGRLSAVDTSGIVEDEGTGFEPTLRQDVVSASEPATREAILSNFPDRLGDLMRVPAVFEHPKG